MLQIASRNQLRMSFLRVALFTVPAVLLLGILSGALSNSGDENSWYRALQRPSFEPPSWAFPTAWTTLYICLGFAFAMLIHARGARGRRMLIALFVVQLLINYSWSPVFFGLHQVGLALGLILVMILLTLFLIPALWRVRAAAGVLLIPYLAWLCLAGALTYRIWVDNPGAGQVAPVGSHTQIPID